MTLKVLFAAFFVFLGLGMAGCASGIVMNENDAALEILPDVEEISVEGQHFYVDCHPACGDVTWNIAEVPDEGGPALAAGAEKNLKADFILQDPRGRGAKLTPHPDVSNGTKLKIEACNSEETCAERIVTVVKAASDPEGKTSFGDCKIYDAVGSFQSFGSYIKISSVLITCENAGCFKDGDGNDYPAGTLLVTVCGKNFQPDCRDYTLQPFTEEICAMRAPSREDGCPDFGEPPSGLVGRDGTVYGFDPGAGAVKGVSELSAELFGFGSDLLSQVCRINVEIPPPGTRADPRTHLRGMSVRQFYDCAFGGLMLVQQAAEWVYSLFHYGFLRNERDEPFTPQKFYECLLDEADGVAFGSQCHENKVDHCHNVASESACEESYMLYCDGAYCDFHNCYWDEDAKGGPGCKYFGNKSCLP